MIILGYFFGGLLPRPLPDGLPVLLGAFSKKVNFILSSFFRLKSMIIWI